MGRQIRFAATVVLGALLLGSALTVVGQVKAPATRGADLSVLAKLVQDYRLLIYSGPLPCGDADCTVPITLTIVPVDGQNICIAKFPSQLNFTNSAGGMPREITWTLDPGGNLAEFHLKNGILVVDDAKSQIKPDNQRTDPVTYKATNKHNQKGSGTYVPVILYRTAAGQPPEVCATGDPQIVNN